jgi:Arc/MetJ-type ribon-helix-helix transcriptional regulator
MPFDVSFAGMKMAAMNISLPASMAEFVRRKVEQNYGNVSEFFRELVREKMRAEIEQDLAFLKSTNPGAPAGPTGNEIDEIVAMQKRARNERHARRL